MPIHKATIEEMKNFHEALKEQPDVIAQMHLTKNEHGKLPIDFNTEKKKEIHRAITYAALNSDLDINTSIKLLDEYNRTGIYTEAIQELKKL